MYTIYTPKPHTKVSTQLSGGHWSRGQRNPHLGGGQTGLATCLSRSRTKQTMCTGSSPPLGQKLFLALPALILVVLKRPMFNIYTPGGLCFHILGSRVWGLWFNTNSSRHGIHSSQQYSMSRKMRIVAWQSLGHAEPHLMYAAKHLVKNPLPIIWST